MADEKRSKYDGGGEPDSTTPRTLVNMGPGWVNPTPEAPPSDVKEEPKKKVIK